MEELTKAQVDWKKTTVVIALVLLTGLTVGGGAWYYAYSGAENEIEAYKNQIATLETKVAQLEADQAAETTEPTKTTDQYAGWKTYTDKTNGYSFRYPASGYTIDTDENNGTTSWSLVQDSKRGGDYCFDCGVILGYFIETPVSNKTLSSWIMSDGAKYQYDSGLKKITVGENTAFRYLSSGEEAYTVYTVSLKNGKALTIVQRDSTTDAALFTKILNSLQFS